MPCKSRPSVCWWQCGVQAPRIQGYEQIRFLLFFRYDDRWMTFSASCSRSTLDGTFLNFLFILPFIIFVRPTNPTGVSRQSRAGKWKVWKSTSYLTIKNCKHSSPRMFFLALAGFTANQAYVTCHHPKKKLADSFAHTLRQIKVSRRPRQKNTNPHASTHVNGTDVETLGKKCMDVATRRGKCGV